MVQLSRYLLYLRCNRSSKRRLLVLHWKVAVISKLVVPTVQGNLNEFPAYQLLRCIQRMKDAASEEPRLPACACNNKR
jgi:hypothetical protein